MADGSHYYNEFDPQAAQWLRNLIAAELIPVGDVDTRSIEDVTPNDLRGYVQCHFFAGIGGWPLALAIAGWPRYRPIWTGSCPCQPFSAAGKGAGFDDQRHLWPAWLHLIRQRRPAVIVGEQVASPDALRWWDLVSADLEGSHYASGAADLCAAGAGAPHIRQRLFWVGVADGFGLGKDHPVSRRTAAMCGVPGTSRGMANSDERAGGQGCADPRGRHSGGDAQPRAGSGGGRVSGRLANTHGGHASAERQQRSGQQRQQSQDDGLDGRLVLTDIDGRESRIAASADAGHGRAAEPAGADGRRLGNAERDGLRGGWRAAADLPDQPGHGAIWIPCADGNSRPASAEPGAFPLAHGIPRDLGRSQPALAGLVRGAGRNRVLRLKGYGNAIVPQVAAAFVEVVMDILGTAHDAQRRAA